MTLTPLRVLVALLLKELLRLRYNRGIQFILFLFLVLTFVIRYSEGIPNASIPLIHFTAGADTEFARELRYYEGRLRFTRRAPRGNERDPVFLVSLPADVRQPGAAVTVRYDSGSDNTARLVYSVITQNLIRFLGVRSPVAVRMFDETGAPLEDPDLPLAARRTTTDIQSRKELSLIMLSTIAITVVSFNLFTIMFSEEKAGRTLLAQLLSPAGATSVLVAKFTLYLALTQALVGTVARIAFPQATDGSSLWLIAGIGSVAYMSLATLVVALSDRQSTASLLSLGYLFLVGIVNLLSQELELFARVREELPETYLFRFLARIYGGNEVELGDPELARFALMATGLTVAGWIAFCIRARRS